MKWHLSHALHGNEPWAVQTEAMKRSFLLERYFYALEQGLGKTPLTLNDFIEYRDAGIVDLALILAPPTFKSDWVFAPDEWGQPDIPTFLWPRCKEIPLDAETGLIAVNYEATRGKAMEQMVKLLETRRVMLVLDESSVIKNPGSKMTADVLDLTKAASMVRELNGTPMTQTVMDWFPQLRAVGALNGMNRYQFRNRYADMGGFMGKKIKGINPDREDELYRIIDTVTFRALKKDWRPTLPEQQDVPVHLEMTDAQRRHYQNMMEEFYTQVVGLEVSAELVLTQMDKLQQISSGLLMQDGVAEWIMPPDKNPKVRATLDLMGGRKTIVVYRYKPTGKLLWELFQQEGLNPARIMGSSDQNPDSVREDKRRFNEDPDCRVILCQEQAACMGHTLLGQPGDRCSTMVFFENSFNLRDRLQMRDRNHRGDQDEPCDYFDLLCSPMDEICVGSLVEKKAQSDMVDAVLTGIRSKASWRRMA